MLFRLATIAALSIAGLLGQVAAFWPRAEAVAPAPLMMDYTFPAGMTIWHSPLVIEGQTGMTIRGQRGNRGPSRMVYRGGPTKAPIQFIGCSRCKLLDLEIVIESPGVDAAVLITNAVNPPVDGYSTANLISNVRCPHTGSPHAPKYSFNVDSFAAGGADGNNEQHRFERCVTFVYSEAAFRIRGSQCHQLVFDGCAAANYGPGKPIGLHAAEGGYFRWTNGSFTNNSIDILTGQFEQQIIVENTSSELSTQFLVTSRIGGSPIVSIRNARVDCAPVAGKPVVDGFGPATISIADSCFAGLKGICPTIRMTGAGGNLDLSGVMLRQHVGTTPLGPLIACPTSWDIRQHGLKHQYIDATGKRTDKKIVVNTLGVQ